MLWGGNFGFLSSQNEQLTRLGAPAERYFPECSDRLLHRTLDLIVIKKVMGNDASER
jgi:hypothetical protein